MNESLKESKKKIRLKKNIWDSKNILTVPMSEMTTRRIDNSIPGAH